MPSRSRYTEQASRWQGGGSVWSVPGVVQRLGGFLDLHRTEAPPEVRGQLEQLVRPGVKVHLGSRGRWGNAGRLIRPWNVIENVATEILVEKGEPHRRRVHFAARGTT